MKRLLSALSLLALLATPVISHAQVAATPPLMNFQGRLAKPDGTPVADGAYSIRFSLWAAASGGTEKWNQTLNPVTVRNGTFGVLLSGFPAGTFHGNLFLEIKIGAETPLTPRQQLVSVAYAMKADGVKDNGITTNAIADNAVTNAKIAGVAWNKITGIPASLLTLPFTGSVNSANSAFSITNTGAGNGVSGSSESGYGGYFSSNSGSASLFASGNASVGLYAESTNTLGTGVQGVAHGGPLAYGVGGASLTGIGVVGNSASGTALYGGASSGYAGYFVNGSGNTTVHVTGASATGLYAETTAESGTAIQGVANNGHGALSYPIGVSGRSQGGIGVQGESRDSVALYGLSVKGTAVFGTSDQGKGIYGFSFQNYGVHGVSWNNYAGYFSGDVYTSGDYRSASDARYKTNIATFPNALDTILHLRGVTFDWKRDEFKDKHFKEGRQIGFIAQEVERVLPELVHTDQDGYKSVAYQNVVPVLVEAFKTQEKRLKTVEAENVDLKSRLSALEAAFPSFKTHATNVRDAL
jgi:hypothetical protein